MVQEFVLIVLKNTQKASFLFDFKCYVIIIIPMDFLKDFVAKKRKELESDSLVSKDKKYFKRGDLIKKKEEEYWQKQKELEQQKRKLAKDDSDDSSDDPSNINNLIS